MSNMVEILCTAIAAYPYSAYDDIAFMFVSVELVSAINQMARSGLTPLCLACKLNRNDIVHLLLENGADPNVTSIYRKSPLHYAAEHSSGNVNMVHTLLEKGAKPSVQDDDGCTPLHHACTESNVSVAKALLDAGADVRLADIDEETPLVRACYAKSVELVDLLLKAGSDPNHPAGRPLEIVVRAPSLESLKLLIAAGADISRKTYLSFASEHNYLDMMKVLHNYGSDVNSTGQLGLTALHHACRSIEATVDAVRLLLLWGADPNLATITGDTALHFACQMVALEKVRLLIGYGADVNRMDWTHTSPLVSALMTLPPHHPGTVPDGDVFLIMIKLLLAAGARLSAVVLERIKVLIVFLHSSASHKEKLLHILNQHTSEPTSLQQQCRCTIRHVLRHGNVDDKVCRLPIPKTVRSFVQFSDVPGCGYNSV